MSKAGLHHLSRNFAGRLGFEGITSNTLACGPFQSKSKHPPSIRVFCLFFHAYASRAVMAQTLLEQGEIIKARIPLGRMGTPEDVAGECLFRASRDEALVNGATLAVDGGSVGRMAIMAPKL